MQIKCSWIHIFCKVLFLSLSFFAFLSILIYLFVEIVRLVCVATGIGCCHRWHYRSICWSFSMHHTLTLSLSFSHSNSISHSLYSSWWKIKSFGMWCIPFLHIAIGLNIRLDLCVDGHQNSVYWIYLIAIGLVSMQGNNENY